MKNMTTKHLLSAAAACAVLCAVSFAGAQSNPLPSYGMGVSLKNIPKFNYTPEGSVVMEKRYDANLTKNFFALRKFPYKANVKGLHEKKCKVLYRGANNTFTDQQKEILDEWGQPDYLRGPFRSTRNDQVNEWVYLQSNHLFQFVDGMMVFEGPLTDQDRTMITYGAPTERTVTQSEPGIRHEFWVYRPWYTVNFDEKMFKFANGKMIYSQVAP